jgi:hypothetical protein
MAGEHSWSMLKKPFQFALMAVIGCSVGHVLMAPLGLFEATAKAGTWLSGVFGSVAGEGVAHGAGEILSSVDPKGFVDCFTAGGIVHPHPGNIQACIPS